MHRVAEYNEKGYTFPVDIFTPAEAAANREYFNWIFAEASTRGINSYKVLTLPTAGPRSSSGLLLAGPELN